MQHKQVIVQPEREFFGPVYSLIAMSAAIGFVYGLSAYDWWWMIGSTVLAILGHVYNWLWTPKQPAATEAVVPPGRAGQ